MSILSDLNTLRSRLTAARAANIDNLDATISSLLTTPINSIQRGTIAVPATGADTTATITSVTTSKSVANMIGYSDSGTPVAAMGAFEVDLVLTNATTVTCGKGINFTSDGTTTVSYEVVEFK